MRFLFLAVLLMLGGIMTGKAQTIPRDSLDAFVAYLPIHRPPRAPADVLVSTFQAYAFAPELQAFSHAQGEGSGILVGFPTPPQSRLLVNHDEVKIPEWGSRLILLNDMLGFERQDAVLTMWEQQGDSLYFDFFLDRTFPTSMGSVRLDGYVPLDSTSRLDSTAFIDNRLAENAAPADSTSLVGNTSLVDSTALVDSTMRVDTVAVLDSTRADSSFAERPASTDSTALLVIVREISEGAFHTVRFIHLQRNGVHRELASHSFYFPPDRMNTSRGKGYDIERGDDGALSITLYGLRKQYVGNYFGYAYVINPDEHLTVLQVDELLASFSPR